MDEAFIRQRRNLLVTSLIVFLISYSGIELSNQVIIFGTKFNIQNPLVIYFTIWMMLFYFLLRYIQYFNELNSEDSFYYQPFSKNDKESYFTLFFNCIEYIFSNSFLMLRNIKKILLEKDFSERVFPIIFAIIIIIISFNSEFTQKKYIKVIEIKKKIYKNINIYVDYQIKNIL